MSWPASATAFTTTITSLTKNANNTFTLANVANIVKGGLTGFRLWGPTPAGAPVSTQTFDVMYFNTSEASSGKPVLQVEYQLSGPKLIWINQ